MFSLFSLPMNDLELIANLLRGDQKSFRIFYEEYKSRVYNTALSLTQRAEDAEEIAQDVFVEVYRSLSSFKKDSSLSTWVYRITVNKSLDVLRMRSRQKRIRIFISLFSSEDSPLEVPHFDHPGVVLEEKERARLLFKHIEALPEQQKAAFILSQIEGLPQKEIADVLKTSEKAVESLIQRAKSNLRKNLKNI